MNVSHCKIRIMLICLIIPVSGMSQTGAEPSGDSCDEVCKESIKKANELFAKDWNLMMQAGRAAGAAESMQIVCELGADPRYGTRQPAWMYTSAGTTNPCEAAAYWAAEDKRLAPILDQAHKDRLEAEKNRDDCLADCEAKKQ